jgi:hypothetical protein
MIHRLAHWKMRRNKPLTCHSIMVGKASKGAKALGGRAGPEQLSVAKESNGPSLPSSLRPQAETLSAVEGAAEQP